MNFSIESHKTSKHLDIKILKREIISRLPVLPGVSTGSKACVFCLPTAAISSLAGEIGHIKNVGQQKGLLMASKVRMINPAAMTLGNKEHCLGERCGIWKPMLRHLKQIWIANHAPGMTAMLQLCYHKGANKAGSRYMSLALQRIAGIQSTNAASKVRMLNTAY